MTIKGMAASPLAHSITQHMGRYFSILQKLPVTRWKQLCILVLALWLSHSLAELFWLVMPEPELKPPPVVSSKATDSPADAAANVDIAALKALNLFGKASEKQKAVAKTDPKLDNLADTRLKLILRGIVSSNDANSARAIIAEGRDEDLYAVGDELPAGRGVKLAKVLADRVILDNNGRYESLWLFLGNESKVASRSSGGKAPQQQRAPARPPPSLTREKAQQSLADVMKVSIVREAGQVVGYRIRPGRDREMFSNLGLKANDVVTSVNGITLDSSSKAMEVYKSMKGKTTAQLEIRRGSESVSLDVDLGSGEG